MPVRQEDYLRQLGERIRALRARRGMTRKQLSHESSVSERYLAQLEAGKGNMSIGLLRQVAMAMGFGLPDMLREGPETPRRIFPYWWNISAASIRSNWQRPSKSCSTGSVPTRGRRRRLALIGLRGAGKSTVAARLADRLDVPFIELAREIEADAGMEQDKIFSLSGQAAFRRYERRSLERVIEHHDAAVIATGGGLVSEPATFELLLNSCFTIWLKASPEDHMQRVVAQGDRRPMADNNEAMDDLRRILENRAGHYAKADLAVDSSGRTAAEVTDEILAVVESAFHQNP